MARKRVGTEQAAKVVGAWHTFPAPLMPPPPTAFPDPARIDEHRAWLQGITDRVNQKLRSRHVR